MIKHYFIPLLKDITFRIKTLEHFVLPKNLNFQVSLKFSEGVRQGKLNGTQEDELISPFGECPLTLSCFGKKETTKKKEKPRGSYKLWQKFPFLYVKKDPNKHNCMQTVGKIARKTFNKIQTFMSDF